MKNDQNAQNDKNNEKPKITQTIEIPPEVEKRRRIAIAEKIALPVPVSIQFVSAELLECADNSGKLCGQSVHKFSVKNNQPHLTIFVATYAQDTDDDKRSRMLDSISGLCASLGAVW